MTLCIYNGPACQGEVTNETARGIAPICDGCRQAIRDREITQAKTYLEGQGFTVLPPGTSTEKHIHIQVLDNQPD